MFVTQGRKDAKKQQNREKIIAEHTAVCILSSSLCVFAPLRETLFFLASWEDSRIEHYAYLVRCRSVVSVHDTAPAGGL